MDYALVVPSRFLVSSYKPEADRPDMTRPETEIEINVTDRCRLTFGQQKNRLFAALSTMDT